LFPLKAKTKISLFVISTVIPTLTGRFKFFATLTESGEFGEYTAGWGAKAPCRLPVSSSQWTLATNVVNWRSAMRIADPFNFGSCGH
jgi:hypothetical protein